MFLALATATVVTTITGGWAIGSAYRWYAGDDSDDGPGWIWYLIVGIVGVILIMLSLGFVARMFGKATKESGVVREVRKAAEKAGDVAEAAIGTVTEPVLNLVGKVV